MEQRQVFSLSGLPKPKSLIYAKSIEYYTGKIAPTVGTSPVPIVFDNGSYEFRAVLPIFSDRT